MGFVWELLSDTFKDQDLKIDETRHNFVYRGVGLGNHVEDLASAAAARFGSSLAHMASRTEPLRCVGT